MWGMIQRLSEEGLIADDDARWDFVLSADACGATVASNSFFFTRSKLFLLYQVKHTPPAAVTLAVL